MQLTIKVFQAALKETPEEFCRVLDMECNHLMPWKYDKELGFHCEIGSYTDYDDYKEYNQSLVNDIVGLSAIFKEPVFLLEISNTIAPFFRVWAANGKHYTETPSWHTFNIDRLA